MRQESAVEVGEVIESAVVGDVGHGALGFKQFTAGTAEAQFDQVLLKGSS